MTITFDGIASDIRIPSTLAEFDATRAAQGPLIKPYRALIIAQKTAAGPAAASSLVKLSSADTARTQGGVGSLAHRMAIAWFKQNKSTEVWLGVLADDGAGVAASGTITVTGPATGPGTIYLYLGGELVKIAVASGDVQNTIAANINAAINAAVGLAVTSTVATNVVTVTFRHKGLTGNEFNMRVNYQDHEALPAGVSLAFVQLASGTTAPALTTLIAAMGDTQFDIIAHPYTDATSLTAIENEMASRFGPMRAIDGVAITSKAGTFSTISTLGDGRNSKHSVIMAQPGEVPITPPWEHAAETAAIAAYHLAIDPARPLQTLPYVHCLPPADVDLFTNEERDQLLKTYGIGTSKVGPGDVCQVVRVITTYQLSPAGSADPSYLDIMTLATLSYLRFSWVAIVKLRFPRHKLASDGARVGAGQAVVTPKIMKALAMEWFGNAEELGLVENKAQFKADLVIERNIANSNRMDALLAPDLMNQLMQTATKIQWLL